jgi:hypothetical protein
MLAEHADQIPGGGRDGSTARLIARVLGGRNRNDDSILLCPYRIRVRLVEVENNARDQRVFTVPADAHTSHSPALDIHRIEIGRLVSIGKIEQDSVRVNGHFIRRLDGSAERDFQANIALVARHVHVLERSYSRILCRGTRQQHY